MYDHDVANAEAWAKSFIKESMDLTRLHAHEPERIADVTRMMRVLRDTATNTDPDVAEYVHKHSSYEPPLRVTKALAKIAGGPEEVDIATTPPAEIAEALAPYTEADASDIEAAATTLQAKLADGNVARADMPSISPDEAEVLREGLQSKGLKLEMTEIPVEDLNFTQKDIYLDKIIDAIHEHGEGIPNGVPIVVSASNDIIDGNHRVANALLRGGKGVKQTCLKVPVDTETLVDKLGTYGDAIKKKDATKMKTSSFDAYADRIATVHEYERQRESLTRDKQSSSEERPAFGVPVATLTGGVGGAVVGSRVAGQRGERIAQEIADEGYRLRTTLQDLRREQLQASNDPSLRDLRHRHDALRESMLSSGIDPDRPIGGPVNPQRASTDRILQSQGINSRSAIPDALFDDALRGDLAKLKRQMNSLPAARDLPFINEKIGLLSLEETENAMLGRAAKRAIPGLKLRGAGIGGLLGAAGLGGLTYALTRNKESSYNRFRDERDVRRAFRRSGEEINEVGRLTLDLNRAIPRNQVVNQDTLLEHGVVDSPDDLPGLDDGPQDLLHSFELERVDPRNAALYGGTAAGGLAGAALGAALARRGPMVARLLAAGALGAGGAIAAANTLSNPDRFRIRKYGKIPQNGVPYEDWERSYGPLYLSDVGMLSREPVMLNKTSAIAMPAVQAAARTGAQAAARTGAQAAEQGVLGRAMRNNFASEIDLVNTIKDMTPWQRWTLGTGVVGAGITGFAAGRGSVDRNQSLGPNLQPQTQYQSAYSRPGYDTSFTRLGKTSSGKQSKARTNPKPKNPELWAEARAEAAEKYPDNPTSLFANQYASKLYKKRGGTWEKPKNKKTSAVDPETLETRRSIGHSLGTGLAVGGGAALGSLAGSISAIDPSVGRQLGMIDEQVSDAYWKWSDPTDYLHRSAGPDLNWTTEHSIRSIQDAPSNVRSMNVTDLGRLSNRVTLAQEAADAAMSRAVTRGGRLGGLVGGTLGLAGIMGLRNALRKD